MKKLFFLLAVALPCLTFTACGDDDDDLTPANGITSSNQSQSNNQDSDENTSDNSTTKSYNAIDLGLSVKWADMNVGATSPEDYGNYFAWGETELVLKEEYSWETYMWRGVMYLTKYCTGTGYSMSKDNKTVLEPEDDAATVNWGSGWRMPTREEIMELCTKCTSKWTTQNGVYGRMMTGPNGNSIFLPAAGYRRSSNLYNAGTHGYYWSSSLVLNNNNNSSCFDFLPGYIKMDETATRSDGLPVRPVCR